MRTLSAASPKSFIAIAGKITPPNPQQPVSCSEDPAAQQAPGPAARWAANKRQHLGGPRDCPLCALLGSCGVEQAGQCRRGRRESVQGDDRLKYFETGKEVPRYARFPAEAFAAALGLLNTGRRERGAGATRGWR